jgi:acetoacetyl-CoA reductase
LNVTDAPRERFQKEEGMARVALVTGGTRGIGAAISKALKGAGYNVAANYAGNDAAAKSFSNETKIPVFKWDVGDYAACEQGIVNVQNEVGPIEVLVNNAGISRDAMLQKMSHEQWEQVMRTNLDSLFNMTRPVINAMREKGFGRIVNISSINGQKGQLGLANYCSAKAGVIGFTRALALESARKGITVNAIAPGYVRTELLANVSDDVMKSIVAQIPVGRLGEADEVARCVLFLAADDAGWITGSTLTINGGNGGYTRDSTVTLHTAVTSHTLWFHQPFRADELNQKSQHVGVVHQRVQVKAAQVFDRIDRIVDRDQVGARELRPGMSTQSSPRAGKAIPWTNGEAIVTAEDAIAHLSSELVRDGLSAAAQFDCQVGDTESGIDEIGLDDGTGRTSLNTEGTASAQICGWFIRDQI